MPPRAACEERAGALEAGILVVSEVRVLPLRVRFTQPPLRGVLFALLVVGGLVPLMLVDTLLVSAVPRGGRLLETAAIFAGGALLLVALAWVLSGWAATLLLEPTRRLSEALGGLARGRFEALVSPAGTVREMAELSDEVNRMSALTLKTMRRLRQSERDNETLASDAMRLFRQAVQAKEPLTRHHPGLLEAYSRAVARQLGERAARVESSEISLSPFTDPGAEPARQRDTRAQPRYEVDGLSVHAPMGARILDVGSSGMGLETMENLPLGRLDTFEIVGRARRLRVPGQVAWCRLVRTVKTAAGDQVPVYRAGVRFGEAVSIGARQELLEIIRAHRQVA